jgi:branched-chain amino acid transport system permease protein
MKKMNMNIKQKKVPFGQRLGRNKTEVLKSPYAIIAYLLALVLFPLIINRAYITHVAILVLYYVTLAISLDLQIGLIGIFNFGQIGFTAIGAYTVGILTLSVWQQWWGFWLSLIIGGTIAAVVGVLLCLSTSRIKGTYYCIVSLGFGEVVRYIALNWPSLTRGSLGLPGIPSPRIFSMQFTSPIYFYWLILIIALVVLLLAIRLKNSYLGRAWIAIREDELAAGFMGVDLVRYKAINIAISSFIAAIAGGFIASYINFINPASFTSNESLNLAIMVILGGAGSIWGSVVGAGILTIVPEILRPVANYRFLAFGLIMLLFMIFRPKGAISK